MSGYSKYYSAWEDSPSTATPITAAALQHMDDAVFGLKTMVFNVQDFGARGDGVHDDTVAIQAAITAAGASTYGGVVRFPNGIYNVSSTLNVTKDNVALVGPTPGYPFASNPPYQGGAILLVQSGFTGSSVISVADPNALQTLLGFSCNGLTISGQQKGSGIAGIALSTTKAVVENCFISGMSGDGIQLTQLAASPFYKAGYDNVIMNVSIQGYSAGSGNGINVISATDSVIMSNRISQTVGHGVFVQSAGCQIIGNHIYATTYPTGYAIYVGVAQDILIIGNRCHSYQGGVFISTTTQESGFVVEGNSFQASTHTGDDNAIDAVTVTSASVLNGGSIGPNVFRNSPFNANRWRYGVNIASANVKSCVVGPIADSHDSTVASAFGTGALNNLGTTTRNFNALA